MYSKVHCGVANFTEIELLGHSCESSVLRCRDSGQHIDVIDCFVTTVAHFPGATHATAASEEVLGYVELSGTGSYQVSRLIQIRLVEAAIYVFTQSVALLQPLRQGENFVGRSRLETRGSAKGLVGVVVHRGSSNLGIFSLIEVSVLGHGYHPARTHLHADGCSAKSVLVISWQLLVNGIESHLLQVEVKGCVNLESTATQQHLSLFWRLTKFGGVSNCPNRVVAEKRAHLVYFATNLDLVDVLHHRVFLI